MFSHAFLDEICALALAIAWNQREDGRAVLWASPATPELLPVESVTLPDGRSVTGLRETFRAERDELVQAAEPWDELVDVAYYAACLWLRRDEVPHLAHLLVNLVERLLPQYTVTWVQLEAGTLATYRRRAAGLPKDITAERDAILAAITASSSAAGAVTNHEP